MSMDKELIQRTIEPVVGDLGCFIVEITVSKDNDVTLTVEKSAGEVTLDDCVAINDAFLEAFDKDSEDYGRMTAMITGIGMIIIGFLILVLTDIAFMVVGAGISLMAFILMISRAFHNAHRDLPKENRAVLIAADCAAAAIVPFLSWSASSLKETSAVLLGAALFAYGCYIFAALLKNRGNRLLAFRASCAIENALAIFGLPIDFARWYLIATGMNIVMLGFLHIYGGQEPLR